jgi:hypothetical protein
MEVSVTKCHEAIESRIATQKMGFDSPPQGQITDATEISRPLLPARLVRDYRRDRVPGNSSRFAVGTGASRIALGNIDMGYSRASKSKCETKSKGVMARDLIQAVHTEPSGCVVLGSGAEEISRAGVKARGRAELIASALCGGMAADLCGNMTEQSECRCDEMRAQLKWACADHAAASDCPDALVGRPEPRARTGWQLSGSVVQWHEGGLGSIGSGVTRRSAATSFRR